MNYIFNDYVHDEADIHANEGSDNATNVKPSGYSSTCMQPRIRNEILVGISMLTIYGITFVTGTFGNFLVLYVIFYYYKMRTVTNLFIANLAVADLLISCSSLWITPITIYLGNWIWGDWLCYVFPLFQGTSIFVSTLTLMSIAVDRYFVICQHSLMNANINEHLTMPTCIAIIAMIWTLSLSLVMPYAVHMRLAYVHPPCNYFICMEDWAREELKSVFGLFVLFLQFILPFTIIIISYRSIWVFLNKRYKKSNKRNNDDSKAENKKRKKLLRMLMTMVATFFFCWLPVNILNIIRDTMDIHPIKRYFEFFFLFAHMISMIGTALNPLLYAWMNDNFRRHFIAAVPGLRYILNPEQKRKATRKIVTDATPAKNRISCADNVSGHLSLKKYAVNSKVVLMGVETDIIEMRPMRSSISDNNVDMPGPSDPYQRLTLPSGSLKSASIQDISGKYDMIALLGR